MKTPSLILTLLFCLLEQDKRKKKPERIRLPSEPDK